MDRSSNEESLKKPRETEREREINVLAGVKTVKMKMKNTEQNDADGISHARF